MRGGSRRIAPASFRRVARCFTSRFTWSRKSSRLSPISAVVSGLGGVIKTVSLACVPEARVDDHVRVHVGLAVSVVDEAEAARVFALLAEMGELADLAPGPPP